MFKKAIKTDAKLRMALSGPAGSGKTKTSLIFATALAEGKPIALVDTEHGSASKYADEFDFDVLELAEFHPDRFVEAIQFAADNGYGVIVLDSLSHAWNGIGGMLDLVDQIAKRKYQGNSFAAWKDATPVQNRMIEAIIGTDIHIIATMRAKTEYAMEKDERTGKSAPKRVGMAPQQRDGFEYEFDIMGELDVDNTLIIQKTRCSAINGKIFAKPDSKVMEPIKAWLKGEAKPAPNNITSIQQPATMADLRADYQHQVERCKPVATPTDPQKRTKYMNALTLDLEQADRATLQATVAYLKSIADHYESQQQKAA